MKMHMRIIVWSTAKVAPKDSYTSDVFVRVQSIGQHGLPEQTLETDVHHNCKKSELGNFNFRMVFECEYPDKSKVGDASAMSVLRRC